MELKRNGFLYGFAYAWAKNPPDQTGSFRFPGRLILSLFIGWPIIVPLAFLFLAMVPTRDGLEVWGAWRKRIGRDVPPAYVAVVVAAAWGMILWLLWSFGGVALPKDPPLPLALVMLLGLYGWFVGLCASAVEVLWLGYKIILWLGRRILIRTNTIRASLKKKFCFVIRFV